MTQVTFGRSAEDAGQKRVWGVRCREGAIASVVAQDVVIPRCPPDRYNSGNMMLLHLGVGAMMTSPALLSRSTRLARICLPAGLTLLLFSGHMWSQESETTPPPRRPRDTPEERLLTSLDFLELRMRQQQMKSKQDKLLGPKQADFEDLRASEKVLGEMERARRAMEDRKHERALEHLKRAVQLDPKYSKAWNNLGLLNQAMGRTGDAEQALLKSVEVNPSNVTAQRNLGYLYLANGRAAEAVKPLSAAASLTPQAVGSAALLGEALFRTGRLRDAAAALERARALAPAYAPVVYRLGCVYAEQERYAEALALFKRVLDLKHPEIDAPSVEKFVVRLMQTMQQARPSQSSSRVDPLTTP